MAKSSRRDQVKHIFRGVNIPQVPHLLLLGGPPALISRVTGLPVRVTALRHPAEENSAVQACVDRVIPLDFVDDPQVLDFVRELHTSDPFHALLPLSEYGMTVASRLCQELAIPGDAMGAWALSRHKLRCRRRLADRGLSSVKCAAVESGDAVRRFVLEAGPAIIKPMSGGGSEGVSLLEDADEGASLQAFERARDADVVHEVIAEEYLRGTEVSVETMSYGGQHHVIGITRKEATGAPFFIEIGHAFPATLTTEERERISQTALSAVAAIGLERGPAHVELVFDPERVRVVEVNARLGGGLIWEIVELATGLDLMRISTASMLGWPVDITPARDSLAAAIRFLSSPGTGLITHLSGRSEVAAMPGVVRSEIWAQAGQAVHTLRSHEDRLGYVIAVGADAEEADERAAAAVSQLGWQWSLRLP